MPLYRWNPDSLEPVTPTNFEAEQLREREDLQRLLRDQPEVLEEGLFVVDEEFGNWEESNRRIDLLCLDSSGSLVVVELKTTSTGDHSELQAIRYAAMVSTMTLDQVINAHRAYLTKRGRDEDARLAILSHLEAADEADAEIQTQRPRILIASAGFSAELTTSVLWLRDADIDIRCVRLQLFRNVGQLLLDASQTIPLPEASDYLVRVRDREEGERKRQSSNPTEITPGASAFLSAFDRVREEYKPILSQLHQWAISLEQENLAVLETRQGNARTTLRASLPTEDVRLAIIHQQGVHAYLHLREGEIRSRAPKANARIAQIAWPEDPGNYGGNYWEVPDGLLEALTEAYREASGLPTTPLPGTGPGIPAPADQTA